MKKVFQFAVLLIFSTIMIFTGCSKENEVPSKKTLVKDLEKEALHEIYDIYESSIIKSRTDEDDGSYVAYIQIAAKSDLAEITAMYKMEYSLYDQGWSLENITPHETSEWTCTPTTGLSDQEALAYLPEASVILSNVVDQSQTIQFQYVEVYPYCTITYTAEKTFYFDPVGHAWFDTAVHSIIDSEEDWSAILGRWTKTYRTLGRGGNAYHTYWADIESYDGKELTGTIGIIYEYEGSYDYDNVYTGTFEVVRGSVSTEKVAFYLDKERGVGYFNCGEWMSLDQTSTSVD